MTAERRANYLERVAAAGAMTSPSAKPAVVAPPRVPGTAPAPVSISLPEPSESAEFIAAPGWTAPPANRLEREPPSALSVRHESPTHPTAFDQPPAEVRISPQSDVEATQHVQEPPDSPRPPPPPGALVHAPSSMLRANTSAAPIPQLIPTRRLEGSPSRAPGRTPGAQAPDSPPSQTTPVKETREPPENPTLRTPLHTTAHAPTSLIQTGLSATPTPQLATSRLASSPSRPPDRTQGAPVKPDVPSAAPPRPALEVPEGSASRERSADAIPPFPVTLTQSQSRETSHTHAPALNPQTSAALPRPNPAAQPVTLPRPAGPAAPRKNETRISIGRIDVQVNNQPGHPSVTPTAVRRASPSEIDLERFFLTRFSMRL
jgi:hypothetical protein